MEPNVQALVNFPEICVDDNAMNIRLDPLDYSRSEDTELGPRDSFRVNAFIAVLDVSIGV